MSTADSPERPLLPADRVADAAKAQMARFHKDFVDEVKAAVDSHHVVVIGMAQNPVVTKAHKLLKAAGIAFHRVDHGSYLGGYRRRLAIKMWSGFPTFPQVFVDGRLVGGASDLEALLASGELKN